jgi:hypothetical protein
MPAYLISLCRHVTDRKRLEDYWANVAPAFTSVIAKPLVAYTPFEILEGGGGVLQWRRQGGEPRATRMSDNVQTLSVGMDMLLIVWLH